MAAGARCSRSSSVGGWPRSGRARPRRADRGADQVELAHRQPGRRAGTSATASHTPLIIISTSSAPTSARTAPAACARAQERVEHADQLGVRRADLVVGQERVGDGLEQRPVGLLAPDHLVDELEQGLARVRRLEQRPRRAPAPRASARRRSPRSGPPWRGSCETASRDRRPRARRSRRRRHRARARRRSRGGVEQPPAVALGVRPQPARLFLHRVQIVLPQAAGCVAVEARRRARRLADGAVSGRRPARARRRAWRRRSADSDHGAARRA